MAFALMSISSTVSRPLVLAHFANARAAGYPSLMRDAFWPSLARPTALIWQIHLFGGTGPPLVFNGRYAAFDGSDGVHQLLQCVRRLRWQLRLISDRLYRLFGTFQLGAGHLKSRCCEGAISMRNNTGAAFVPRTGSRSETIIPISAVFALIYTHQVYGVSEPTIWPAAATNVGIVTGRSVGERRLFVTL